MDGGIPIPLWGVPTPSLSFESRQSVLIRDYSLHVSYFLFSSRLLS